MVIENTRPALLSMTHNNMPNTRASCGVRTGTLVDGNVEYSFEIAVLSFTFPFHIASPRQLRYTAKSCPNLIPVFKEETYSEFGFGPTEDDNQVDR